jgi:hypothetical protein
VNAKRRKSDYYRSDMPYKVCYYGFECPCGAKPTGIRVGITSLAELAAEWTCENCKAKCLVKKSLQEVVADIPDHPFTELTATDKDWMKGMHICE